MMISVLLYIVTGGGGEREETETGERYELSFWFTTNVEYPGKVFHEPSYQSLQSVYRLFEMGAGRAEERDWKREAG